MSGMRIGRMMEYLSNRDLGDESEQSQMQAELGLLLRRIDLEKRLSRLVDSLWARDNGFLYPIKTEIYDENRLKVVEKKAEGWVLRFFR
jgi:hypothetical protein